MDHRLYRSRKDVVLGGVCGGLGKYLDLDPTLVRIFFVLLALGTGTGVFLYLLLWIFLPAEDSPAGEELGDRARRFGGEFAGAVSRTDPRRGVYIGWALVLLGGIWLIQNLNLPWLRWLDFGVLWPILLIVGGIVLIARRARGG